MSYNNNASFEQVSEEANGGVFSFLDPNELFSSSDFEFLFNNSPLADIPISGVCDLPNFTESQANCVEPHEFDGYLGPLLSDASIECDNKRALINNMPMPIVKTGRKSPCNTSSIPLSQSVGVGLPQNHMKISQKVHIVYPLEEFFRPRYKSDYFAQNGKSRKPRYVADRTGNHFITLKVPTGVCGQIRIDWLTIPDKCGNRYSMPYRFQQSNESADVPDCNPMYVNVSPDKNGTMKLYLVLIKSKQDELKTLQPLKPFRPFQDCFGMPEKSKSEPSFSLNPKQLIQKYQLEQSQLAFTFCAFSLDGKTRVPEWDTTVFSSVMTEMPPESAKQREVTCPHCLHSFSIVINGGNGEQDNVQETGSHKRKVYAAAHGQMIKKRNSLADD